jgi:ketosteroid isomerase-like protein
MWRSVTAGLLLSITPSMVVAQRASGGVDEVRQAARQYLDARLANDTAAIRRLLSDDFVSINSNGTLGDRAAAMRLPTNVTPNGEEIQAFELDSVEVRVYGTTAIMIGARRVRIGGLLHPGVRFTSVFLWRDDRWQLATTHATDILRRAGTGRRSRPFDRS